MAATSSKCHGSLLNIPDSISISFFPDSTKLSSKSLEKGLLYYKEGYVHDLKITTEGNKVVVGAKCWRSMSKSKPPHSLTMEFDLHSSSTINDSYCSCKAGLSGHCSHAIGLVKTLQGYKLLNFKVIPDVASCTSLPQQWHKPRGLKINPIPMNDVVVARANENRKRKPIVCQTDVNTKLPLITAEDITVLQGAISTPLAWLQSNTPMVKCHFGMVQIGSALSYQTLSIKNKESNDNMYSRCCSNTLPLTSPVSLPSQYEHLNNNYFVPDPSKLEMNTNEQAESVEWKNVRSTRLTASNFGLVLNRKSQPSPSLLNTLFNSKEIHAPSLQYGKRHETNAKTKYLDIFKDRHIHKCGFVVNNKFSFLGATPDGKICDNGNSGIIEIKCPYSARNMDIESAIRNIPEFPLSDKNTLKPKHPHYAQVQGQLMITGCNFCDYVIFTQLDFVSIRIFPDLLFMKNMLLKLSSFFQYHALPHLEHLKTSSKLAT